MHIREALAEFLFHCKQHSPQTRSWYTWTLGLFAAWSEQHGYELVEQITAKGIGSYIDYVAARPSKTTGEPLSSHYIHSHARAIRTFVNWLANDERYEQIISPRIGQKIPMPHLEHKIVEIFDLEEIGRLFSQAANSPWPVLAARDKAILAVLLDTGIRAGELCGLTLDHCFLDDTQPYIKVMGKGSKEREVGLGAKSLAALSNYLQKYRLAPGPDCTGWNAGANVPAKERRVFLGLAYEPLTRNGLVQLLARLGERAAISRCYAHKFRHTFACLHLTLGGDIHMLSRLMGHTDITVTSTIYLSAVRSMQARLLSKSVLDRL